MITLNGTTGITNDGGYTGDGIIFADATPANTLVTTTGGNVGIGTTSTSGARLAVRSGTGTAHTILGNDYGALYLETASGGPNRITSLNSGLSVGQALAFNGSGGAEWGRFDTSGNLLVGTTSTFFANYVGAYYAKSTATRMVLGRSDNGGGSLVVFTNYLDNAVGSISVSNSATTYATSSDYRLKEDIQPMTGALAKVAALKPCTYKWNADGSDGEGFIAHELAEVAPQCVTGEKDAMRVEQYEISPAVPATYDEEGNELTAAVEAVMGEREVPVYQGIDTSFLVATLTAAIQELKAIVDAQGAEIAALKGTPNV